MEKGTWLGAGPTDGETESEWQRRLRRESLERGERAAKIADAERAKSEAERWAYLKKCQEQKALDALKARQRTIERKAARLKERHRIDKIRLEAIARNRPADMGGPRDEWQVWTPEMQAREFGLI